MGSTSEFLRRGEKCVYISLLVGKRVHFCIACDFLQTTPLGRSSDTCEQLCVAWQLFTLNLSVFFLALLFPQSHLGFVCPVQADWFFVNCITFVHSRRIEVSSSGPTL